MHFVEDMVQRKVVKFVDCMTDNNVSEITTKPLGGAKFIVYSRLHSGGGSDGTNFRVAETLNPSIVKACYHGSL